MKNKDTEMKDTDFFISYNHKDESWATWIAGVLEENGYSTIIQAWDFLAGNDFVVEMHKALQQCKKTIIVLSENYLKSEYCRAEWSSVFARDPTGNQRILIPVRIEDVKPNGLLKSRIYIDLVGLSDSDAEKELLYKVNQKSSRTKPSFPGKTSPVIPVDEKKFFHFEFFINDKNKAEPLSVKGKNMLREWYLNEQPFDFDVNIVDERIEKISKYLLEIDQKINREEELSYKEEEKYNSYKQAVKEYQCEDELKTLAITFFLKDRGLQAYFGIDNYFGIFDIVKNILDFDDFGVTVHNNYTSLDFTCYYESKKYVYFVVPIEDAKISGKLELRALYFGAYYITDLGIELLKDISVYFYMFLAEELLSGRHKDCINEKSINKKVLNLLEYKVGLH